MSKRERELERVVLTRVMRLNETIHGVVAGIIGGIGLFAATLWLVLKGGPVVGPHLGLLGNFFIGYSVSWGGSIVGFLYGFLVGFIIGFSIARLYNLLVDMREGLKQKRSARG